MSLLDVIDSLASDTNITVTRRTGGTMVDGIWVPGTPTTFLIPAASIQPATGMQRVVGGAEMRQDEQGQHTDDVRAVYTYTELKNRRPGIDPDQVTFDGGIWIVTRVERWQLNSEVVYKCMMTRETRGAS